LELRAGDEVPWPCQSQRIGLGEVLLLLLPIGADGATQARHPLACLPQGSVLPGRPAALAASLECRIKALQDCRLDPCSDPTAAADLAQRLQTPLAQATSPADDEATLAALIAAHWQQASARQTQLQASHQPLDDGSELQLFWHLECAITAPHGTPADGLQACVQALLQSQHGDAAAGALKQPARLAPEPRTRLQQWLASNGLIGRDVVLNGDLLRQDCGDLIGFLQQSPDTPVLLLSGSAGYRLWVPDQMPQPLPVRQARAWLDQLNPRVVAVSPTFGRDGLSSIGLVRFAYGAPEHRGRFVIGGLLIGLAVGFVLAVGREVGAARWIFGMGFAGLTVGGGLGCLSGGFRIGMAVMLLATLLGLLTPTFNTVITNQALPDRDLGLLRQITAILIVAGLTRVALEWTQSRSLLLPQQQGAARSQLAGLQRLLTLPLQFFQSYSLGHLQLRFGALDELRREIQTLIDGGLLKVVLSSIYVLFLLRISVKLTVLACVIALMMLIPTAVVGLQSRVLQRRQEACDGQAQGRNLELISSVAKLRLAGAETRAARWWAEPYRRSIVLERALDAKEAVGVLLSGVMPNLGNLLLYIVITRLLAEGVANPSVGAPNTGELLGFFSAFGTFIGAMASFADLLVGAFDVPVFVEQAKPILTAVSERNEALLDPGDLQGGVAFDRVSYRYASDLPLVLDGVSFAVQPGQFIAVVGPSGSGKSTLVRLMLGFAKPENGTIRYDSQPLNGLQLDSVRRQIGTVLQHSALFSGSLFEAIAGGCLISHDEAWHAAERAGLADDIRQMPMGMQTVIPDGGGTLSGGQRQRVAIARALVRRPRLLIFDEATSALDNRTQAVVSQSLERLAITRIVIAHRLSTVRQADQILVLQQGQVRQRGCFDTLMAEDGLFAELMNRQIT